MEKNEKAFEDKLIAEFERRGAFAHHFDANGCDGWPDILVLRDNRAALVECKWKTMKVRKDQAALHLALVLQHDFTNIYVVSTMEDGYYFHDEDVPRKTIEELASDILFDMMKD